MEFMAGGSLTEVLSYQVLPEPLIATVCREVCRLFLFLHRFFLWGFCAFVYAFSLLYCAFSPHPAFLLATAPPSPFYIGGVSVIMSHCRSV